MEESNIAVPCGMPCTGQLHTHTFKLSEWQQYDAQKRVLFLNLMPQKAVTEQDIVRTLAQCGTSIQLLLMKIKGQTYKTTPMEHMNAFYLDFEAYEPYYFDHLIVTGAPLEQISFEEVRYWTELCRIMDWADQHVAYTLYICWGAQAGLYKHYGIRKYALNEKMFGIFTHNVLKPQSPLMKGFANTFRMPNSRHTEVHETDLAVYKAKGLEIIATSSESGVGVVATTDCKRTFVIGHFEYEPRTLHYEYQRDLKKCLPIQPPKHYYRADGSIDFSWKDDAIRFYANWLNLP